MDLIISTLYFIIVLGIAIFFHELGHFLVAKWVGVRVEKFSIGFGRRIFSFKRGDTEYIIAPIPLGGYVKMAGDNPEEELKGLPWEFLSVNPWRRIAIVIAGPSANVITAFLLIFLVLFLFGLAYVKSTVIGEVFPNSPALEAGLKTGDRITAVNGVSAGSWNDIMDEIESARKENSDVILEVIRAGNPENIHLEADKIKNFDLLKTSPPQINSVEPGSPAEKAGIERNALILSVKDQPIHSWNEFASEVKDEFEILPNGEAVGIPLAIEWKTESGEIKSATLVPQVMKVEDEGKPAEMKARVGVYLKFPLRIMLNQYIISEVGISPARDPIVGRIQTGSPADLAGIRQSDVIVALNGEDVTEWYTMFSTIWESYEKTPDGKSVGKPIELTWLTPGGKLLTRQMTPEVQSISLPSDLDTGETSLIAQVGLRLEEDRKFPGLFGSLGYASQQIYRYSADFFSLLYKIFAGEIKAKAALGGPVAIFKLSGQQGRWGMEAFLLFVAILCVNLAWINLLPIPILDGGHILIYSLEIIRGKGLTLKQLEWAQKIGMAILLPLIVAIFWIDFSRYGWFKWLGNAISKLFGGQ